MKSVQSQRDPGRRDGAWTLAWVVVPLFVCCGLPALVAASGGLLVWAGLHGALLGAMAAVVVGGGALTVWRTRRGAAAACAVCEPEFQKEGAHDAGSAQDQRHALS